MTSAMNPPDSPPAGPVIPEGLATKLGKFGAPVILLAGILTDVSGVELDGTSEKAFYSSLGLIALTMAGRFLQSYAALRDAPSPSQKLNEDDYSGELDVDIPEGEPPFPVEDFSTPAPDAEVPDSEILDPEPPVVPPGILSVTEEN